MNNSFNYKTETGRYNYYYRRLKVFYQKPVSQVSSAVLFSLATIIFFAVFAIKPTLVTIGELLKKIDDQKVILEKAKQKTASLAVAQQLYNQITPNLSVLDEAVPPDYQIQQFLLWLESAAGSLKIPIKNITVDKYYYPPATDKTTLVQELGFTVSFNTSYPNAKILLSNFNQLPRLITINSVTLGQEDQIQSMSNQVEDIKITLDGKIYYFPEINQ